MPVHSRELVEAIQVLADDRNIRATLKSSLLASGIVAGATLIGALIFGKNGIPAGALAGGSLAYLLSGDFKSVADIIREDMTDEQRNKLSQHIMAAFREFNATDIVTVVAVVQALRNPESNFQAIAVDTIRSFFTNEMGMRIID